MISVNGTVIIGSGGGASLSDATPAALGTAAAGVATSASRADHVHEAPASGGTHGAGTLAARPAVPAAGDTYAVTSGVQLGARYTCFIAGVWEGSMPYSAGHSWERLAPGTAGGGARFVDVDSLQTYASSGQAVPGWGVELPSGLGTDRAGLDISGGSVYRQSLDLSAYPIDACTLAVLFSWAGPIASFATLFIFGDNNSTVGTSGASVYLKANGVNFDIVVFGHAAGSGTFTTLNAAPIPAASLAAGLHAFCLAPVNVSGTHKWRWSLDGSAAVDTPMAANYVTPITSGLLGVCTRHDGAYRLPGALHDFCAWPSTLSGANMAALTTLPGTPTYRLPESAATGAAAIRAEAARYDATFPLVLPVRGLPVPLTVDAGVRKVAYP